MYKLRTLTSRFSPADFLCLYQAAVKRAVEIAERSANAWEAKFTDFFTPPVIADVLVNLKPLANIDALAWGGYPQAERARLILAREEIMLALKDILTEVCLIIQVVTLELCISTLVDLASCRREALQLSLCVATSCLMQQATEIS